MGDELNGDEFIGTTIGHHKIVKRLGHGELSTVYLAEHPGIKSRLVVKVLRPEHVGDTSTVRRFLDEARAVNLIEHPGIIRIHDCDMQEGLGVLLMMEHLQGESLAERLEREPRLAVEVAVRVARQTAAALEAAHEAGVIHRSIRPSMIFLATDPEVPGGQRVKLLGFGAAKLMESQSRGSRTITGEGLGVSLYISPEQNLDAKRVDRRADIFSLAAVTYHMLGGRPPYPVDNDNQLTLAHEEPPESLEGIPAAIDAVVSRALARDPERRHRSMAEFAGALAAALNVRPPAAGSLAVDPLGVPAAPSRQTAVLEQAPAATPAAEPSPRPLPASRSTAILSPDEGLEVPGAAPSRPSVGTAIVAPEELLQELRGATAFGTAKTEPGTPAMVPPAGHPAGRRTNRPAASADPGTAMLTGGLEELTGEGRSMANASTVLVAEEEAAPREVWTKEELGESSIPLPATREPAGQVTELVDAVERPRERPDVVKFVLVCVVVALAISLLLVLLLRGLGG